LKYKLSNAVHPTQFKHFETKPKIFPRFYLGKTNFLYKTLPPQLRVFKPIENNISLVLPSSPIKI